MSMKPPTTSDTFQMERFYSYIFQDERVQWDYRNKEGKLFSGIAKDEAEAVADATERGYQP